MGRIETLIILPVASFHLPVVAWGKGADEFVADPVEFQMFLEQGRLFVARGKTVGKLCAIISLNAFDWTREGLYQMFYKLGGRIGAVLLKCFHKTPAGVLVNGRVLENCFPMTWEFSGRQREQISHQPESAVRDNPSLHRA